MQQALAVVLPLLSLIVAYVLIVPRYVALRRDQDELRRTSQVVATKRTLITQAEQRGAIPPVVARVPGDPSEAINFLRQLNGVARSCGVSISTYSANDVSAAAPAAATPPANSTTAAAAPTNGLPPDTTPRDIQLSVSGPFRGMAQFFASLENYERLVSVSNVTMSAAGQNADTLTAQFRLTRYVGPPSTVPAVPVAAAPAP